MEWWMWVAVLWPLVGTVAGVALGVAIGVNKTKTALVYAQDRRARLPVHGSTRWDSRP